MHFGQEYLVFIFPTATLVCEATSHPQNKAENHSPEKQVHLVEETHREEPLEVPKNSSNSSGILSIN